MFEIVPIFVCVVLPIAVVLIISLTKINGENKRAQVIIKAIEANKDVDTDKLIESLRRPRKSAREILNFRLLMGCIFSLIGVAGIAIWFINPHVFKQSLYLLGGICLAIGLSYLIVYFVTRNQANNDSDQQ